MIDDIVKSIRASLYERTSSPLFGAFSISWIVWNHRFFIVLFSSMPAHSKFEYIDQTLYCDPYLRWIWWVIGPLVTAALLLFIYPYPAKWVYQFWRKRRKELLEIRQRIEDESPMTLEEGRRIRRRNVELQTEYELELRRFAEEVDQLKQALVESKGNEEQLSVDLAKSKSELASAARPIVSDQDVKSAIMHGPFRLVHNPSRKGANKPISFEPGGLIVDGKNNNENSWRIVNGRLELLQSDGKIHSRFEYHPASRIFTHTNEVDTLSARGQTIIPEVLLSAPAQ